MKKLLFAADRPFSQYAITVLKRAMRNVTSEVVEFVQVSGGQGVLGFGVESQWTTLSPEAITFVPSAERVLIRAFREVFGMPPEPRKQPIEGRVLYFDIETHSIDERWNLTPQEYFRMGQYAWGADGEVIITVDYDEMIEVIRSADLVVGHNIHSFDLSVLFGKDSTEPLEMARDGKVFDTFVYASTTFPAPNKYVNRNGTIMTVVKPEQIMKWLSLDNLAFQFDVGGKIGDLSDMAKRYGGYCHIPLVLTEFIDYARQDVVVAQELCHELIMFKDITKYDWREQKFAAVCAQISRNGFKVDIAKATARRDELAARKAVVLNHLVETYNFPTVGKAPWSSKAGKAAILKALDDAGIDPYDIDDWPILKTGPSLGGQILLEHTEGTPAEELGQALAELKGIRSLSQLALDSVQDDGFAHPELTFLQRSGRTSVQRPGLTVWSSNGEKAVEKSYFVPDNEDELLVEMDYSNADGRIVAAYSGDEVFLERMDEGFDSHEMSGRLLFGDKVYDTNPKKYRQMSKGGTHGWAYLAGAGAIVRVTKVMKSQAQNFIDGMNKRYAKVVAWQRRMSRLGESGRITNAWGREMLVEIERSHTQSPALMGQSGTREIMVDALLRMLDTSVTIITWIKVPVHDAIVYSIPKIYLKKAVPLVRGLMETEWQPPDGTGQLIQFPVAAGEPATDWEKAGH